MDNYTVEEFLNNLDGELPKNVLDFNAHGKQSFLLCNCRKERLFFNSILLIGFNGCDFTTPDAIKEYSLGHTLVGDRRLPFDMDFIRRISNYCLMSQADCYTQFHRDFTSTSVFYHMLEGEKDFYLIIPTDHNLTLFERYDSLRNKK